VLQQLDLADIGDFVVMASTLMEIKSRELLPNETVEIEQELDPRDDLIRRLLEYKRYRDLARQLERRADLRSRQAPLVLTTPSQLADKDDEDLLDIGNVGIWDLTSAFAKLLEEIGQQGTMRSRSRSATSVTTRAGCSASSARSARWRSPRSSTSREGRYGLIGTLIALLEMMKQGYLRAHQENCFDEIQLAFRGGDEVTADQILAGITAEEEQQRKRDAALAEAAGHEDMREQALAANAIGSGSEADLDDEEDGSTLANLVEESLADDDTDEEPTYQPPPREFDAEA
jgi:segregation and condensation protein A